MRSRSSAYSSGGVFLSCKLTFILKRVSCFYHSLWPYQEDTTPDTGDELGVQVPQLPHLDGSSYHEVGETHCHQHQDPNYL